MRCRERSLFAKLLSALAMSIIHKHMWTEDVTAEDAIADAFNFVFKNHLNNFLKIEDFKERFSVAMPFIVFSRHLFTTSYLF